MVDVFLALLLGFGFLLLLLFPVIVIIIFISFILLLFIFFFGLYVFNFNSILPEGFILSLVIASVLLLLLVALFFHVLTVVSGVVIMKSLKNYENNAFLLTKNATGTFRETVSAYKKVSLFFFLAYGRKMFSLLLGQWPLFFSVICLLITNSFLNTMKVIDVRGISTVAKIDNKITRTSAPHNFFVSSESFRKGRPTKNTLSIFH